MENHNFQDWSSCEMYGHNFVNDGEGHFYCTDCDASYSEQDSQSN